ncbi:hypothetical protein DFP73DRAFT_348636 [Morchella snyderi]|nr:hypothetical protein DFP73DRAFT_348636 [Morchella snyderi]
MRTSSRPVGEWSLLLYHGRRGHAGSTYSYCSWPVSACRFFPSVYVVVVCVCVCLRPPTRSHHPHSLCLILLVLFLILLRNFHTHPPHTPASKHPLQARSLTGGKRTLGSPAPAFPCL